MSGAGAPLLVVAGEASGDRIAAEVLRALGPAVHAFGIGGRGCRAQGMETLAETSDIAAMGTLDVLRKVPALGRSLGALIGRIRKDPPRAALLVNFTELNARLGRALRRRGTHVLWAVAPQVWAWRAGRIHALHDAVDRLAVVLPFEELLWREAGYDARFVGHPSAEAPRLPREVARAQLGLAKGRTVAVLPGSRAGEITRLAPLFCEAASMLTARGDVDEARVLVAPWLDARARGELERAARRAGVEIAEADAEHGASPLLSAFDLALCASGTACLEAALAGLPTVIGYRVDPLTYALARRLVRTPHIGLPNVLLGRRAYPELLQDAVTNRSLAATAAALMNDAQKARAKADARALDALLRPPSPGPFGARVAALLDPWL
ncbi:lipid-A-disaccharide synthase [Polyangium jinanense]|uniref:Lipid-A-disaccharide synthase n=1 Tax=Polyangium jinanense TaxID=2829994 RepID=A0A9X3X5Z9_9BACT|nr:lipid-A-disaccharide synthase [Polyangium jinanense]MDC3959418.1 lipid-A-disaccharide synthase [Polyangium jinanense]MDC3984852.1 lipid-A-disaccharide synthase [Polyangium jinanense]